MYSARKFITSYFYYSRGERNGVIVLAALSLVFMMFPKIYSLINMQTTHPIDLSDFEKEIAAFAGQKASDTDGTSRTPSARGEEGDFAMQSDEAVLFSFNPNDATKEDFIRLGLSPKVAATFVHFREKGGRFFKKEDVQKIYGLKASDYARLEGFIDLENKPVFTSNKFEHTPQYGLKNEQRAIELKPFDPNTATADELLGLGLDDRSVKVLLKYREKGGRFKTKEDIKKVYGLSEIDYLRLNSYIQIIGNQNITKDKSLQTQTTEPFVKSEKQETKPFDLNQANLEDLIQLHGIGRTFAARIIEHRERLGGFSSLNQLKEVYGLPDSTLRNIMPFLRLSSSPHRKIKINKATIEELLHPYIQRKQADIIIRYRVNHGGFKDVAEFKKTGIFTDIVLEKLRPYLIFD